MSYTETIHIGLCADEKYSLPLGVCMTSIFENNRNNNIEIHIITTGLKPSTKRRIDQTAEKYNQKVSFILLTDEIFNDFPQTDLFPKSIYYRYLFPKLIGRDIEKLLYLDCDTIVIGNLSELWNSDIKGFPIAAVKDANGDDIINRNRIEIFDGDYLNSGVLMLNLDYWRKNDCLKILSEFIKNNPQKCLYPDQDALNVVFHNKVFWLSFSYNFQITLVQPFDEFRLNRANWTNIVEAFRNVTILHYSSFYGKPWYIDSDQPLSPIWKYFYKISLWKDCKLGQREGVLKRLVKKILKYKILKTNINKEIEPLMHKLIWKYI